MTNATAVVLVQPLEQRMEQGGLAGSDLTGQEDEALALLDPVEELGERLLVRGRQVEKAGVGRRIERRLPQTEEGEVHAPGSYQAPSIRTSCSLPWATK